MVQPTYTNIRSSKGIQMFAPATKHFGFQGFDGLLHFFAQLGAAFAGALAANRVYHDLARLSDAELAARGLTRDDVVRMTLQALNKATDR
jgi:hypothetical protein